jgi:hypothetical protein
MEANARDSNGKDGFGGILVTSVENPTPAETELLMPCPLDA